MSLRSFIASRFGKPLDNPAYDLTEANDAYLERLVQQATAFPTPAPKFRDVGLVENVLPVAACAEGMAQAAGHIETRGLHQLSNALTGQPKYAAGDFGK